ncbi:hypothetical protein CAC42_6213 [Sphaceloma murrayae]|uniref:Large ribosomal subunit protein uL23m n=1 Tax=Sphaceloma murrayae TaxID=2082308 RepID=A0A2K1QTK5_9PEZI|nr:hypothetical protein CAC42_6213 [Sphaceloma murrayae]
MATGIGSSAARSLSQTIKRAPFRLGQKQVFLPSFTITLLNVPDQSPYYATFQVPLNFNKLDLRDYLFNAYNVGVHHITSRIQQMPVEADGNPRVERPQPGRLYRRPAIKRMTVRLDKPFVWPEAPGEQDLKEQWGKNTFEAARQANRDFGKKFSRRDTWVDERERDEMRVQARRLLEGKDKWRPPAGVSDGSWAVRVVS